MRKFATGILLAAIVASSAVISLAAELAKAGEDPEIEAVEDEEGNVDVLEFNIERHDQAEVDKEVNRILAEDWADTWDPPQHMKDLFPYYISGKDEDGAMVFVKEFGRWDFAELVKKEGSTVSREMFDKYYEQYLHRFLKEGQENGAVIIFDFDGFTLQHFNDRDALKLMLRQFTTLEKTSKVLKQAFLINTNFAAQTLINIARPFMGTVLQIAEIYGTRKEKWLPKLLKKLPKEAIPKKYL